MNPATYDIKHKLHSFAENKIVLTPCIPVKQKRMLELEVQVFGDWLCQVLHTESIHNGETMSGRCQSAGRAGKPQKEIFKYLIN